MTLTNSELIFALHEMNGIGPKSILNMLELLPEIPSIWDKTSWPQALKKALGTRRYTIIERQLSPEWIERRKEPYRRLGISIITQADPMYPPLLRQIPAPPWVLYVKGQTGTLKEHAVSIVGTRQATPYGKKVAHLLAADLSRAGLVVVSGLALGIDTSAHRGALEGVGGTIAVMGTSFDSIYPRSNEALADRIAQQGAIVTEFPLGTTTVPGMFPMRNRIIAGLSHGTLVVEAAERSGALITTDLALLANRDVFAIPGALTSKQSVGSNQLIKQRRAIPVHHAGDILEEIRPKLADPWMPFVPIDLTAAYTSSTASLSDEEREMLRHIKDEPVDIDTLQRATGYGFGLLHAVLLNLTVKHQIKQLPGALYTKR